MNGFEFHGFIRIVSEDEETAAQAQSRAEEAIAVAEAADPALTISFDDGPGYQLEEDEL